MSQKWRSPAARELAKRVTRAGGAIERTGVGKIRVTGPDGTVTIQEPGSETRRDLQRSSAVKLIKDRTGLDVSNN